MPFPDLVTCYYRNPTTGKVEKHVLSSASWDDVKHRCVESHLWSTEKPEKSDNVVDMTPKAVDFTPPPAASPPIAATPITDRLAGRRGASFKARPPLEPGAA
jgi:hypothetical protein